MVAGLISVSGHSFHYPSVVFRLIALEGVNVSGSNLSRFFAVANFANINSNEIVLSCRVMPVRWYSRYMYKWLVSSHIFQSHTAKNK